MTPRERLLSYSVIGTLALAAGTTLVRSRVVRPMREMSQRVVELEQRRETLVNRIRQREIVIANWQKRTERTLGVSAIEAQQRFRFDVQKLLEAAGVTGFVTDPLDPYEERKGFRKGFVELPVSVRGEMTLEQLVHFLREFYRRPYVSRVTTLSLSMPASAASAARTTTPRKGAAQTTTEPRLSVLRLILTTLVLPGAPEAPSRPLDAAALNDPDELRRLDPRVLAAADLEEYDEIARTNVFKLYVEPPRVAERPPPDPRKADEPPRPPPRRDPREHADKLRLVATTSLNGEPVAWVEDERRKSEPPAQYRLNDSFDDGRLVLIHPLGVVVRVPAAAEEGRPLSIDYFYSPEKKFTERLELKSRAPSDPAAALPGEPYVPPEILHELSMAFPP